MIPKIIHYCWFGGKTIPLETKVLIKSWHKIMPDYEFKCWTERNIDINWSVWLKQSMDNKKWAFAADYIRLYALYKFGGVYMDTDVEVYKSFDEFLPYSFFSSVEVHDVFYTIGKSKLNEDNLPYNQGETIPGLGILSALVASEPMNNYVGDCLNFYDSIPFINNDGSFYTDVIIPDFLAREAVKYGFRYEDRTQYLDKNIVIFNSTVFAGDYNSLREDSFALHFCFGTWREKTFSNRIKWWYRYKLWAMKKLFFIIFCNR